MWSINIEKLSLCHYHFLSFIFEVTTHVEGNLPPSPQKGIQQIQNIKIINFTAAFVFSMYTQQKTEVHQFFFPSFCSLLNVGLYMEFHNKITYLCYQFQVFARIMALVTNPDTLRTGISPSDAAMTLGIAPGMAKEHLLTAESKGKLLQSFQWECYYCTCTLTILHGRFAMQGHKS